MTLSGNITALLSFKAQREGWSLIEDEDFIELFYQGKQVGAFSKRNRRDLNAIEKFIEESKEP